MTEITSFDGVLSTEGGIKSLTGKSVVLDFYADWCGPCKISSPAVEKLSQELTDINFYKINVDKTPELSAVFTIRAIPTFIVITPDGKVGTTMGWEGEDSFKKFIEKSVE